jgi:hypothetical protein
MGWARKEAKSRHVGSMEGGKVTSRSAARYAVLTLVTKHGSSTKER